MPSLLRDDDRRGIEARLSSLTDVSLPQWGDMSVSAMLTHLCQATLNALGELSVVPRGNPVVRSFPLKHCLTFALLYVLPFPRGANTSPELLLPGTEPVEASKERLRSLLQRFSLKPAKPVLAVHGLLGPLSRKQWGVLVYKHVDHHLRQFGA